MAIFQNEEKDHPVIACFFCERLLRESMVCKRVKNVDLDIRTRDSRANFVRLMGKRLEENEDVEEFVQRAKDGIVVCNQCWNAVAGKKGDVGPAMLENSFEVCDVPDELKELNYFEQMMIEKARAFFTVVQLSTCRKQGKDGGEKGKDSWKRRKLVDAVRGNAVQLWMPVGETSSHVLKTLPAQGVDERLRIFARSLPVGDNVWQNLVSMEKVLKA